MQNNKKLMTLGAGVALVAVIVAAAALNQGGIFSGSVTKLSNGSLSSGASQNTQTMNLSNISNLNVNTIPSVRCSASPNPGKTGTGNSVTWTATLMNTTNSTNYVYSWDHGNAASATNSGNNLISKYALGTTTGTAKATIKYDVVNINIPGYPTSTKTVTGNCSVPLSDPVQNGPATLITSCSPANSTVNVGQDVNITGSVVSGGTAPYKFRWEGQWTDNQGLNNATLPYSNPTTVTLHFDAAHTGQQTVVFNGLDSLGNVSSHSCTVQVNPITTTNSLYASCSASNNNPLQNETVVWSANASGGTAPYTYSWSGNYLGGQTGQYSNGIAYANIGTQSATVTVKDANNQVANAQCILNVHATGSSNNNTPTNSNSSCAGFVDINVNDSDCNAFTFVRSIGAMTGNPDGSFRPEGLIQRDQIAKIALETFGLFDNNGAYCSGGRSGFPDVGANDWSFQYVCRARSIGVITGYLAGVDKGYFRPSRYLNRAEFLAIILRNLPDQMVQGTSYSDVSLNDWFSIYARYAYVKNLYTSDRLYPENVVTRREAAQILYKIHQLGKI